MTLILRTVIRCCYITVFVARILHQGSERLSTPSRINYFPAAPFTLATIAIWSRRLIQLQLSTAEWSTHQRWDVTHLPGTSSPQKFSYKKPFVSTEVVDSCRRRRTVFERLGEHLGPLTAPKDPLAEKLLTVSVWRRRWATVASRYSHLQ